MKRKKKIDNDGQTSEKRRTMKCLYLFALGLEMTIYLMVCYVSLNTPVSSDCNCNPVILSQICPISGVTNCSDQNSIIGLTDERGCYVEPFLSKVMTGKYLLIIFTSITIAVLFGGGVTMFRKKWSDRFVFFNTSGLAALTETMIITSSNEVANYKVNEVWMSQIWTCQTNLLGQQLILSTSIVCLFFAAINWIYLIINGKFSDEQEPIEIQVSYSINQSNRSVSCAA